jgi:hypothetical protein
MRSKQTAISRTPFGACFLLVACLDFFWILRKERTLFSGTTMSFHRTTRYHVQKDCTLHIYRCENLKSTQSIHVLACACRPIELLQYRNLSCHPKYWITLKISLTWDVTISNRKLAIMEMRGTNIGRRKTVKRALSESRNEIENVQYM